MLHGRTASAAAKTLPARAHTFKFHALSNHLLNPILQIRGSRLKISPEAWPPEAVLGQSRSKGGRPEVESRRKVRPVTRHTKHTCQPAGGEDDPDGRLCPQDMADDAACERVRECVALKRVGRIGTWTAGSLTPFLLFGEECLQPCKSTSAFTTEDQF